MNYIFANTWNGEGYSYLNTAELVDTDNRMGFVKQKFSEQIDSDTKISNVEIENRESTVLSYDIGFDSGTLQLIPYNDKPYGVVIWCNINEVSVLQTKEDYDNTLAEAIEHADPDDDIDMENPFINAYSTDYDAQFIKF